MRGRKIVRKYLVHSPYKPIVKTTRFKQPSYTAWTLLITPALRGATLKEVIKSTVKHECEIMCKVVPSSSVLRSSSVCGLKELQWKSVLDELNARAPVLLSILTAAATSGSTRIPPPTVIGMATAVLLKARSKNMCKIQAMIGALLYTGHASKQVISFCLCIYTVSVIIHTYVYIIGVYQIEQAWCVLVSQSSHMSSEKNG